MVINLRPYQHEIVNKTRNLMSHGKKSVLIQLPTGGGKTALASYMVKGVQDKNKTTWFCVHRKDLIRQTAVTFDQFNIPYSYIASGYSHDPYAKTHICSIDTLRKRLDKLPAPDVLMVDESHMAASSTWSKLIKTCRDNGSWVIGLTATPIRTDGSGLDDQFDDMVRGPSMRWLIDNGFLSEYKLYAPHVPDMSGVGKRYGEYAQDQLAEKMMKDRARIKDALGQYKKLAAGKLSLLYAVSREDSKNTAAEFCAAGIPAVHMDGETSMEERRRLINKFADREIQVLTNVALMDTGFDLASQVGRDITVECIIDTAPTQSLARQLQKFGRGLRKKDYPAIIIDTAGNSLRHGLPCDEREWSLKGICKGERGEFEKTIPVKTCEKCFFTQKPCVVCKNCGYEFPINFRDIDEIEGDLKEVKKELYAKTLEEALEIAQKNNRPTYIEWSKTVNNKETWRYLAFINSFLGNDLRQKYRKMEVGMAKTYGDLKRIADDRGYKSGWIMKQAQLKGIKV